MELLSQVPLIGTLLPFLLVLGVVVFVHEYGHYIVGRWCGIGADVFSIGFGPELFGWTDKRGTRWRVAAVPLGGYVKFTGDADVTSSHVDARTLLRLDRAQRSRSFHLASVERRALTVAAGPAANFLLSILIFAALAMGQGRPDDAPVIGALGPDANAELALLPGDRVLELAGQPVADFAGLQQALTDAEGAPTPARVLRDGAEQDLTVSFRPPARVDGLTPGGAAEAAGVLPGDVVVAVDGRPIAGFSDLQRLTRDGQGAAMALTLRRDGAERVVTITPRVAETVDPATGQTLRRPLLGVTKLQREIQPRLQSVGPLGGLAFGADRTWAVIATSLSGLGQVVMGTEDAREVLGGPIRIAEVSGEAAADSAGALIGLIAVLSASIGMINLFPIPVLDGGHLMFYAVEKLRGRPLRPRWQEIGTSVGLALVLALMLFATFNDLSRL